ncbi:MAG: DUF6538 domain-containing protein [Pseudolabrys sp.]
MAINICFTAIAAITTAPSASAPRQKIGKQFIQNSLNTTSLAEAKKLLALRDLQWDARFDALKDAAPERESAKSQTTVNSTELSEGKLLRLVREYVEDKDKDSVSVLQAILRSVNGRRPR